MYSSAGLPEIFVPLRDSSSKPKATKEKYYLDEWSVRCVYLASSSGAILYVVEHYPFSLNFSKDLYLFIYLFIYFIYLYLEFDDKLTTGK